MQTVLQWIVLLASTFLQFILQGYLICILFNKKVKFKHMLLFALINSLVRETPMLFMGYSPIFSYTSYFVVMFITIKYILGFKNLHNLFSICILLFMASAVDFIDMSIAKAIIQDKYNTALWANSFSYSIIMRNVGNLTTFIIMICIYSFKMKINIPEDVNKKKYINILINCILSSIFISINYYLYEGLKLVSTGILLFDASIILILLVINIYGAIKSSELEILKQEMNMQKLYTQTLTDSLTKLRGFKHDFNNMATVIGGFISAKDLNGLKNYYSQMLSEIRYVSNSAPLNEYLKENPALYGLVLSKMTYSEINNIQLVLNFSSKYEGPNIKIYDFCKVLGILLDNALEAAGLCEKKYVEFTINKSSDDRKIIFAIMNTYCEEVDTDKIFENGFTTKRDHSGFGLWEVNKIVSKYPNLKLSTFKDDFMFTQKLEITL